MEEVVAEDELRDDLTDGRRPPFSCVWSSSFFLSLASLAALSRAALARFVLVAFFLSNAIRRFCILWTVFSACVSSEPFPYWDEYASPSTEKRIVYWRE